MKYNVVATHNPQDFFNDIEPHELTEYFMANDETLQQTVSKYIKEGYTVIIYLKEEI